MGKIARKKGREGSAGPKYIKMCQKFPYFWCQKRNPQNAFFLLSTGTIIATNTVGMKGALKLKICRSMKTNLNILNGVIIGTKPNKKNAF